MRQEYERQEHPTFSTIMLVDFCHARRIAVILHILFAFVSEFVDRSISEDFPDRPERAQIDVLRKLPEGMMNSTKQ